MKKLNLKSFLVILFPVLLIATTFTVSNQNNTALAAKAAYSRSTVSAKVVNSKPVIKKVKTVIPAGASARCRDKTYSFSHSRRGTCSHHGVVAEWL